MAEPRPPRGARLRLRVLAAFVAVYLIWGSTFLAIRIAIDHIPPLLMCGGRLFLAGAALLVWARARGAPWPSAAQWRNAACVGVLLPGLGNSSVTLGETRVPSGLVALLVGTIPLWMALFEALGPRAVRPRPVALAGLALGFAGIALLVRPHAGAGAYPGAWALVPIAGSLAWSWGSLWSRRADLPASPVLSTGIGLAAGGVLVLAASAAAGELARFEPARVTAGSLAAFAYLIVFGSVVGFTAYLYLLRHVPPGPVSTYAFVNPIVALALGVGVGHERLDGRAVAASALVLVSVVLLTTSRIRSGSTGRSAPAVREGTA